jgi:4-amino-4-deoxy-L-arabinose transferase
MNLNSPLNQFHIFIFGFILLSISIFFFEKEKIKLSLIFLVLGSFTLGYFISHLDPFLVLWDEQYHALVAKNMADSPFVPKLYNNPILGYDYHDWSGNYIWLHKQPLFLWQIALSIKIFGTTEFAVRFPSLLMHAIIPLLIFRIGKISINDRIGFYASFFFATAFYPMEMVAGKFASDHNDAAFVFYVTASIWAWFEHQYSQNKFWIILIGLFAGCAVLVKWLTGLLIYAVWITVIVGNKESRSNINTYFSFCKSLLVSFIIFIPWQIYKSVKFPLESSVEYQDYNQHFFTPMDGHGGDIWFHFDTLKTLYGAGDLVPYLILFGLVILYVKIKESYYKIAVFSAIILVYGFYTIAATKMPAFCMIVCPFIFLAISSLFDAFINSISRWIKNNALLKFLSSILLLISCYFLTDISEINSIHTADNPNWVNKIHEKKIIMKLDSTLHNKKYVIFNSSITLNGHIPIMFYTNYIAYDFIPTPEQLILISSKGYHAAIYNTSGLPEYILQDNSIIKIKLD